jgi:hypothetical protein
MRTLLPLVLSVIAVSPVRADLSVGFGEVDLTPALGAKPVFMAGFGTNRVATKVHDPIVGRAVVLADGAKKIALVSVDLVGLFHGNVEAVRQRLAGFDYVLISSTHNHEGPDTLGLWGRSPFTSGVDPDYLARVEAGCVEAVKAADAARKPAAVKIGAAKGPELIHDARLPVVKHDDIVTLQFVGAKGEPLGILVQWNCHPETLDSKNTELTADYVGDTVKHLQTTHKCPVAYFTGTVGGLMSSLHVDVRDDAGVLLKDGTFEKARRYGIEVGKLADRAIAAGVPATLTPFAVKTQTLLMPVENNLYRIGKQAGVFKRAMYLLDGATADPTKWVETTDAAKPVGVKTEVGYLRLGELEVAAIPGEIYPELVLGKVQDPVDPGADFPDAPVEPSIYGQLTAKHRMLVGLANDQLGYFIPKRQWDDKPPYCYGRKTSQYGEINSVGPNAAKIVCESFRGLVTSPARPK